MAYIFPLNPFDGQLYPVPAQQGALQYQWNEALKAWLIFSPLGVQSVTGLLPIVVSNGTEDAVVSILPATINAAGSMSAADKSKLDNIPSDASSGTVTQILTGAGLSGGPITTTGQIDLEPATRTTEGGVIIGDNIDVDISGVISIPTARFGVQSINIGPGLVGAPAPLTSSGTISAALATRLSVGAVRVGAGIQVAPDGTISLAGPFAKAAILAYASVQVTNPSNPPTFTVLESYNISSISWIGPAGTARVRITFQNPLENANYGFISGCMSQQTGWPFGAGDNPQRNNSLNLSTKTLSYVDVQLCTQSVQNTVSNYGNNTIWNDWGNQIGPFNGGPAGIDQFDISIIDTPVL
jgi:hypothetical protein